LDNGGASISLMVFSSGLKLYREFFDRCSRAGFAGAHELGRLPKRVFDIDSEKGVFKFPIHANYYNYIKNAINIRY